MTHESDPYFYLSPLKLETIMETPAKIYLYHSLLSSKQVDSITEYTELMVSNVSYLLVIKDCFSINLNANLLLNAL